MSRNRFAVGVTTLVLLAVARDRVSAAPPAAVREIELTDGTTLRAEIVSLHDGVFHLRSSALGDIDVPESRVRRIATPPVNAPAAARNPSGSIARGPGADAERRVVENLAHDPAFRDQALALQDDPTVQSILSDAALMDAIHAGDLGRIANDPKIQELMRKPAVRALTERHGQ
ncbi:MAG TPA: hypothetical protein VFD92_13105 [Candidatus Binatia bacterium]|nr:hypothetical protein [Candidatus Binatia bacterium]